MHNEATVIGRVVDIIEDRQAKLLIVEDRSNEKYPQKAACRFWGDKAMKAVAEVAIGHLVRAKGSIKSREHQGKWYTEFSAWSCTILGERYEAAKPAPSQSDDDDEKLPF